MVMIKELGGGKSKESMERGNQNLTPCGYMNDFIVTVPVTVIVTLT